MPRPWRIRRRRRSLLRFLAEFALISLAVFVGLLADEWREGRSEARLARDALERFRSEVVLNEETAKRRALAARTGAMPAPSEATPRAASAHRNTPETRVPRRQNRDLRHSYSSVVK